MNVFAIKRSNKVSSQFRKHAMRKFIIRVFEIFNLADQGCPFIEIGFTHYRFKEAAHFVTVFSHFFKQLKEDFILWRENLEKGIETHDLNFISDNGRFA